ncbi:hypothetical protein CRH09_04780 [Nocardia terpenica]|uniref:Uncharacterized protein n=2 Tax=Nocardia terpenica TaxID=455432 RepID=A0A291RE90_9NOCA|nr:hypothetical protein CRH09_04780 [Nocardia terpenica]
MYCRIDPGPVREQFGRMLLRIHDGCDERNCRPKLRGMQAVDPDSPPAPQPECRVPDDRIAAAVARLTGANAALLTARAALRDRHPDAARAMITATADFAAARRHRDALFLRALPGDGTVPAAVIGKFGISYREVRRLVPSLGPVMAQDGSDR